MCVRVALFLACTFHGPVPPLHVSPASPPCPFPSPARRLFHSAAARSFSVSVQLTCSVFASFSRPIRRPPPVPWCVPACMRHEKGSAEASSRSIVKRWLELVYIGGWNAGLKGNEIWAVTYRHVQDGRRLRTRSEGIPGCCTGRTGLKASPLPSFFFPPLLSTISRAAPKVSMRRIKEARIINNTRK